MKEHKTLRLESELIKTIKNRAEKENRSFNNMAEQLLNEAVKSK